MLLQERGERGGALLRQTLDREAGLGCPGLRRCAPAFGMYPPGSEYYVRTPGKGGQDSIRILEVPPCHDYSFAS